MIEGNDLSSEGVRRCGSGEVGFGDNDRCDRCGGSRVVGHAGENSEHSRASRGPSAAFPSGFSDGSSVMVAYAFHSCKKATWTWESRWRTSCPWSNGIL